MGWNNSVFPLIIIPSGSPNTGLFVYNGPPALGNLVAAIVAPGVTQDPYGNHVSAVFNAGKWNASGNLLQHFGIDSNGDTYLANTAGATVVREHSADGSIWFYNSSGQGLGNLVASIAPASGTDVPGNAYLQGITNYSPGVAYVELVGATVRLATLGANASALAAALTVGSTATGQTVAIGSGQGPEAGAVSSQLSLGDSGAGTGLQVADGKDGNTYATQYILQHVSPRSQSFSAVTGANIAGLSVPVVAKTYTVRGRFNIQWNAAAGTPEMSFAGPAVSQQDTSFVTRQTGTSSTANTTAAVNSSAGSGNGYGTLVNVTQAMSGAGTVFDLDVWGVFTFTAAGTLTLQAASSVAGDAWIVNSGFWEVNPG